MHPLLEVPGTDIPYLDNPSLSNTNVTAIPRSVEAVVLYQARPRFGGRWVALLDDGDTRAKFIPEARWQAWTSGGKVLSFPDAGPNALSPVNKSGIE